MPNFKAIDLHKKKSDVLIVHCSDPRFQSAYRSIIDELDKYYDHLVFPGASKAIAENKLVVENIALLHSLHKFETVYILDHIECGAFGEVKDEKTAHKAMFEAAKQKLHAALPGVEVSGVLVGQKTAETLS